MAAIWLNSPERPVIVGQAWLGSGAGVTAGGAWQTLEYVRIVIAYIVLMLLPGNLHDGAIEAIRMPQRIVAPLAQALIRAA